MRNAERGILGMEITFLGRASHTAAARSTGINAIAKAAKGILALEKDIDKFHPAVGKPVISINTISAGVAHNVVPGEATISIDRRLIPGETKETAVAEVREALDAIAAEDPDFRYEMIDRSQRRLYPGEHHARGLTPGGGDPGERPRRHWQGAGVLRRLGWRDRRPLLPTAGIDTVGFGPTVNGPMAPTSASTSTIWSPRPGSMWRRSRSCWGLYSQTLARETSFPDQPRTVHLAREDA